MAKSFWDHLSSGFGKAVNFLDDAAVQDRAGQKRSLSGELKMVGQGINAAGTALQPVVRNNQHLNNAANWMVNSDLGKNVVMPFTTGLASTTMGATGLSPQYLQQRDAVQGNSTLNIFGKNPFMFAGELAGDPTNAIPFKAATLPGKFALGSSLNALSGAITPAANPQERNANIVGGAFFGGLLPLTPAIARGTVNDVRAGFGKANVTKLLDTFVDKIPNRRYIDQLYDTQWSKHQPGHRDDMRALARQMGMPQEFQKMSGNELKEVFGYVLGRSDNLSSTTKKTIQKIAKEGSKSHRLFHDQGGFADTGLLTGGLDKKVGKLVGSTDTNKFVDDYAQMLKEFDDGAKGGFVVSGAGGEGSIRATEHSQFYRKIFKEQGRKPTLDQWRSEAKRLLDNGLADQDAVAQYRSLSQSPKATITTGRDLANKKLNIQKQDAAYIEQEFGRAATPAEQSKLYNEWERALKRETATPNQNLNRQNAVIRGQNADRKRLANELFREDPLREKGVKVKVKPNVSDAQAGFPSRTLATAGKDKATFSYQRETLLRNLEETFGRGTEQTKQMKSYLFDPIVQNETNRTRMVNRIRGEMSELMKKSGIKRSSKEDFAAADFIEGTLSKEDLQSKFPGKADAIISFAEEGRRTYKDLLTRTNEQLTKYGYDPIPERNNYVTHTTQLTDFWEEMGNFLNFDKDKLPTAMSGIHTQTKPGKQFNPFALQRQGGSTHEGLATAMDRYLDVTTKQMFHTADVKRAREIQNYLQQQASSAAGDSTHLSNFNKYISQYADSLAGKKSELDRGAEALIGRGVYSAVNKLRQRFGANAIGGSISSAVTNSIPMTQAAATTNKIAFTKGLLSNMKFGDDALIDGVESAFLRRRFPVSRIGSNAKTVARDVVSGPFHLVDKFTSKSVVAGKFYEGLQKGLDPQTAMDQADEYAARLLSDRSFGQSPLLFNSQTAGFFTQFQNEVNNQVSFLTKDIPKNLGMNKAQAASALTQVAIFGYLYNEMYEKMNGRRPAVDPIDIAMKSLQGDWEGAGEAALNTVPFASSVAGAFGMETGRIPMAGGIPDFTNVLNDPVKELTKPLAYFAPPYGGGQIKKTIEGLQTYGQGGDFAKDGDTKFEVEATPGNAVRSALFGKWSTPEAQEYIQGIGKKKPVSTTQVAGVTSTDASERLTALKEEKKRIEKLPTPGFLREGVTEDERAAQLAEIDKQIKNTELSSKFDFKGDTSSPLGSVRASDKQKAAVKAVYTAYLDGDISQEQAAQIFQENGIDPKQAEYAYASSLNDDDQAAYAWEALNSGHDWKDLVSAKILTAAVAKKLYLADKISEAQYKGLTSAITPASAKKAKKITFTIPKSKSPSVKVLRMSTPKVSAPKFAKI